MGGDTEEEMELIVIYRITPVHLFVIEGTASIAERQELRKSGQ